jgi:hypothetical protein
MKIHFCQILFEIVLFSSFVIFKKLSDFSNLGKIKVSLEQANDLPRATSNL